MTNFMEKFIQEYGNSVEEMDYIIENFKEADFKRFYNSVRERVLVKEIDIKLPFKPVEKSRPRVSGNRMYDPDQSIKNAYVNYIKRLYEGSEVYDSISGVFKENKDLEIEMEIIYYKSIPKAESKRGILESLTRNKLPTTNPDIDNYDKFLLDVLQLTDILEDDSMIVKTNSSKEFSIFPRIEFKVKYYTRK